jgi:acyl carrier protein
MATPEVTRAVGQALRLYHVDLAATPLTSTLRDLHIDSLALVELACEVEDNLNLRRATLDSWVMDLRDDSTLADLLQACARQCAL